MRAYNAGPGTVTKAMEYAKNSGNINNWMNEENYQRAILFYGAFSYSAAVLGRLKNKSTDSMISIISQLISSGTDYIVETYRLGDLTKVTPNQFYGLVEKSIKQTIIKIYYYKSDSPKMKQKANISYEQLLQLAKEDIGYKLILYSIQFKYKNTQNYVDKIILVKEYYDKAS